MRRAWRNRAIIKAEWEAGWRPQDLVTKVRELRTLGYSIVYRVSQKDGELGGHSRGFLKPTEGPVLNSVGSREPRELSGADIRSVKINFATSRSERGWLAEQEEAGPPVRKVSKTPRHGGGGGRAGARVVRLEGVGQM